VGVFVDRYLFLFLESVQYTDGVGSTNWLNS
jgi:hypothetical protein